MTKRELITELQMRGETWANNSYSKKELERYYNDTINAKNMTMEELLAKINAQ